MSDIVYSALFFVLKTGLVAGLGKSIVMYDETKAAANVRMRQIK